ncbi:hypothetical protein [Paractinoplanes deccanensis]|uniref:hypothetical protein n=1 Tax=Paractinoplanes deccanensis TaxID=113561 RepID=UPI00366D3259
MLEVLRSHPHKQGWQTFYGVLQTAFVDEEAAGRGILTHVTAVHHESRPNATASHYVSLLCIALKGVIGDWRDSPVLDESLDMSQRVKLLTAAAEAGEDEILDIVLTKQNSFSGARRFLVPQIIVSHFAHRHGIRVRLADLGTGAGLLPRQLNDRASFERFSPDLTWESWKPSFVEVDYEQRWGLDRTSPKEVDWFRQCYGPSAYYDDRYAELVWAFEQEAVKGAALHTENLDLLDAEAVARFVHEHQINVVTCSFVLYQWNPAVRKDVINAVVGSLRAPGLFVSLEPTGDLLTPGASIRVYLPGDSSPIEVGTVSDGHCIGTVAAGPDFDTFRRDHL